MSTPPTALPRSKSADAAPLPTNGNNNNANDLRYLNQPRPPLNNTRVSSDPTHGISTSTSRTPPDIKYASSSSGSSSHRNSTLVQSPWHNESFRRISVVGISNAHAAVEEMPHVGAFRVHQGEFFKFADLTDSIEAQATSSPQLKQWRELNGIIVNPVTLAFQSTAVEDEYERFKFRRVEKSVQLVCLLIAMWGCAALVWDYRRSVLREEMQSVGPWAYALRQGYFLLVLLTYSTIVFVIARFPGMLFIRASDRMLASLITLTAVLMTLLYPESLRTWFAVPGIPSHLDLLPFRTMTMTVTWLIHALSALSFGLRFKTVLIGCLVALASIVINLFVVHRFTEDDSRRKTETISQMFFPIVPLFWGLVGVCWTSYVWDSRERHKFVSMALSFEAKTRVQAAGATLNSGMSLSRVDSALSALQLIKNDFAIGQNHAMTTILEACITALAEGTSKRKLTVNDFVFNGPPSPGGSPGSSRHTSSLEEDNISHASVIPSHPSTLTELSNGGGSGSNIATIGGGGGDSSPPLPALTTTSNGGGGGNGNGNNTGSAFVLPVHNRHRRQSLGETSKATMQSFIQSELSIEPDTQTGSNWMLRRRSTLSTGVPPATLLAHATTMGNNNTNKNVDVATLIATLPTCTPPEFESMMRDWNFGPEAGLWSRLQENLTFNEHPLTVVMVTALQSLGMFGESLGLDMETTTKFFLQVERTYRPREEVPYHNAVHATDVVQCCYSMIRQETSLDSFPELAIFALLFGAAIHDLAHPGLNNAHLVSTKHHLALTYNDLSPLENFHVSRAFQLMIDDPSIDLLQGMKRTASDEARQFRSLVVDMVLATDLKNHFDQKARFRVMLAQKGGDLDFKDSEETSMVCQTLLNAADMSNVAKSFDAYQPWISRLFDEFYAQGKLERNLGLEVAPHMDPDKSLPYDPQMFFISTFVMPLFSTLKTVVPVTAEKALANMEVNLARLEELKQRAIQNVGGKLISTLEEVAEGVEDDEDDSEKDDG